MTWTLLDPMLTTPVASRDLPPCAAAELGLVVEVDVDVARDVAGRWRHPVRLHRPRPDLPLEAVTLFGE